MEEWKDVRGYEDFYEVSNKGNIRTKSRLKIYPNWKQYSKPRLLKPSVNSGYLQVVLYNHDGAPKTIKVHRVVATTWIDNPEEFNIINHKDKNITNNSIDNLEWCTNQYNVVHGVNRLYEVTNSLGESYYTNNLSEFCDMNSITKANLWKVLKGVRKHAKGWTVRIV